MMSVSIWRQHSVDNMLVDISMHHIKRTLIILDVSFTLMLR